VRWGPDNNPFCGPDIVTGREKGERGRG
jgi:hypothetical protein